MSAPSASRWRDGRFEPLDACEVRPVRLLAADSWLLRDGAVVELEAHRRRFLRSLPAEVDGTGFWDAAIAELPRSGAWFPRLELRSVGFPGDDRRELALRLRPAPELRQEIALVTHDARDPRAEPLIKGPDLEALTRVRTLAQARTADDAALLSADGRVAETTTAHLVWWRGDVLCAADPAIPQLPGVTVGALTRLAGAHGVELRAERATAADLAGTEVWALNALHGIRVVTTWHGGPSLVHEPGRAELWRERLGTLRHPLPQAVTA
ncbi:aminotransferase class IV [Pseudolysinimonas sp.]|uniref:aminotransferase class IV n=1 Tax=Pseudolysinimonas sp. TaxID=2680009 RepID=UPI003F81053A